MPVINIEISSADLARLDFLAKEEMRVRKHQATVYFLGGLNAAEFARASQNLPNYDPAANAPSKKSPLKPAKKGASK